MSKKEEKFLEKAIHEFQDLAMKSAQLIYESAEANNIPHIAMSHGAACYIRSICLAMKMSHKDFLIIIKNLTDDYQKDLDRGK